MCGQLYVLGHPVDHSKSPVMHNAAYAALGLPWQYGLADCESLDAARAFVESDAWLALNITMPYKPLALACAQVQSDAARLARGANVLVRVDGRLHADNVDGKGCVAFLRRQGTDFCGKRVVVCGTGPTSLSIMHACAQAGASKVTLLGRNADKTEAIVREYNTLAATLPEASGKRPVSFGSYAQDSTLIAEADIIVDATPLGMKPNDPTPFDTKLLSASQTVMDVVYGHGVTKLVESARIAGCAAYDGSGMLVGQAVETVRVISRLTGLFTIPDNIDLHAVMAKAAGFGE